MKPRSPAPVMAPSLADRLATLAGFWLDLSKGEEHPTPPAEFDALRDGLNSIALEAEAGGQGGLARALRRIALLSELWECLECDPERAEVAADVAEFCLGAIERLGCDQQTGGDRGEPGTYDEILRQSDERWGEYLSPIDSTSDLDSVVDEPASFEEDCNPRDDSPPAIDQQTLLRLLQGPGDAGNQPAPHQTPVGGNGTSREPGLKIPPLPTRFDLDDEMRDAFLADSIDLFERIEQIVVGLDSLDDHRDAIHELGRCFHTLKGAAGSVGLNELATLVHELEERLGQTRGSVSPGLNDLLHQVVDYLDEVIGWLGRRPASIHETNALPTPGPKAIHPSAALPPDSSAGPAPTISQAIPTEHTSSADGPIRVPVARLDELTDLASELIGQGRFWLSQAESMKTFAATAQNCRNRLLGSLDRLHDAGLWQKGGRLARRSIPRPTSPLSFAAWRNRPTTWPSWPHRLKPRPRRWPTAVIPWSGSRCKFWDSFQSLRIVPIRGLFQRLARVLHDAARVEGRQIEVVMKGEETGVDRGVQDKAFEPLLHVVRNAVGHGIESPSDRIRAGKPATGCVTLEARREGNALVIVVRDDGKGLDDEAIADKARRLGWLGPDEKPSRERLHTFVFQPGFSTKSQANAISGRGVGMDVVAREVERLRGTLDLASQPLRGTQLTLRLPARLALEPALIVRVGGQPLAVPALQVEHAQPFEPPVPSPDAPHDVGKAEPDRVPPGTLRDIPRSGHPGGLRTRDAGNWPVFLAPCA